MTSQGALLAEHFPALVARVHTHRVGVGAGAAGQTIFLAGGIQPGAGAITAVVQVRVIALFVAPVTALTSLLTMGRGLAMTRHRTGRVRRTFTYSARANA